MQRSLLIAGPAGSLSCLGCRQATPVQPLQAQQRLQRRPGSKACRASAGPVAKVAKQETEQDAYERRMRETLRVEERVTPIYSKEDFEDQLQKAGHNLVVLEVEASDVCQTGLAEEAELQWEGDKRDTLVPCQQLKHVLQRTARDSPDAVFLTLEADGEDGHAACDALGIEVLPTLQFWRDQQLLWEHRGVLQLEQSMGEGVLYYGDQAAHGQKASEFVKELTSREDFQQFISSQQRDVLTVVDVSLNNAEPCIHIFPAVLALAKNFVGFAAFARLIGDSGKETQQIMAEHKILEVPTFLFFRDGKEVGRHVGSSRADLIGQILAQQSALGISPPTMKGPSKPRRQKIERRT